jgi:hypothetical protein
MRYRQQLSGKGNRGDFRVNSAMDMAALKFKAAGMDAVLSREPLNKS